MNNIKMYVRDTFMDVDVLKVVNDEKVFYWGLDGEWLPSLYGPEDLEKVGAKLIFEGVEKCLK